MGSKLKPDPGPNDLRNLSASHAQSDDKTNANLPKLSVTRRESLNVLTLNVCGLKSYGRIDQVHHLLLKYQVSVAVLTETEVSHDIAKSFSVEGYIVFCPSSTTTGPRGKEAGLIILVSNDVATFTIAGSDISKSDSILTIWLQLKNKNVDLVIGSVYR